MSLLLVALMGDGPVLCGPGAAAAAPRQPLPPSRRQPPTADVSISSIRRSARGPASSASSPSFMSPPPASASAGGDGDDGSDSSDRQSSSMANGTQMATARVIPPIDDAPHGCGGRSRHEPLRAAATAIDRTPRRWGAGDCSVPLPPTATAPGPASSRHGLSGPRGSPMLSVTDADSVGTSLRSSLPPPPPAGSASTPADGCPV